MQSQNGHCLSQAQTLWLFGSLHSDLDYIHVIISLFILNFDLRLEPQKARINGEK